MIAREITTKNFITVNPSMSVQKVAQLMTKKNVSGVLVSDNGKIVGSINQLDVIGKKGHEVNEVMTKSVVSVSDQTQIEEVASLMMANKTERVLVMDGESLLGIVSQGDIVKAIAEGKHVAIHSAVYDL
jgi:CBS domain-containing protein